MHDALPRHQRGQLRLGHVDAAVAGHGREHTDIVVAQIVREVVLRGERQVVFGERAAGTRAGAAARCRR